MMRLVCLPSGGPWRDHGGQQEPNDQLLKPKLDRKKVGQAQRNWVGSTHLYRQRKVERASRVTAPDDGAAKAVRATGGSRNAQPAVAVGEGEQFTSWCV